jgi:3-hydroxybutyryl-CoA dehydrogenase
MITDLMRVTVVGSGYMGKGIAQTLARGGALVTLVDKDPEAGEDAYETMLAEVRGAETEGLLEEGATAVVGERSGWAPSVEQGVRSADLVVEAVFEDVNLKLEVLAAIERWAPESAVIATNTSAIPVESLACALARPERLFGIHWFNPAPYLPSVEVILSKASDESLLERVLVLLESSGKSPVVVADTPGFVANRLQLALFKEAALMVEEGTATAERIDAVVRSSFGFRLPFFGPFAIADMAGLDVYANSYKTLAAAFGPRFSVPRSLKEKVEHGELGIKTGTGYLRLAPEEVERMVKRRDRCYVELLTLRSSLEKGLDP